MQDTMQDHLRASVVNDLLLLLYSLCYRDIGINPMGEPCGADTSKCHVGSGHALREDAFRRHVSVNDGRRHGGSDEANVLPWRNAV